MHLTPAQFAKLNPPTTTEAGPVEIELPYPPSVNHVWRTWKGRTLLSKEGRHYRALVAVLLRVAGVPRLSGELAMQVDVYPPDRRRRDLGNLDKVLSDSLQHGGLFDDDSQIADLHYRRCAVEKPGKVVVRVRQQQREATNGS
jgi:crossover junction endodeoxyribonuclease RusA